MKEGNENERQCGWKNQIVLKLMKEKDDNEEEKKEKMKKRPG